MERRVPGGQREIAGAVLTLSTMGGFSVTHQSDYVGYLHASVGDQFTSTGARSTRWMTGSANTDWKTA